jgi:hypothetical protein
MLIMPPGHQMRIAQRRPLTRREKWGGIAGGLIALVVVVVVLISLVASPAKLRHGCIDVSLASSLGSQSIARCGASARTTCRELQSPGSSYSGEALTELLNGCRRAGLPTT